MKENVIAEKSFAFALRIVRLYQFLCEHKKEYVIGKQLLRCGTAVGALVREAEQAESKAYFYSQNGDCAEGSKRNGILDRAFTPSWLHRQ